MGLFDIFRRKKSGTASPSTDSKRGDWRKWFLNREGLGGMKFNPDPGGYIDYSPIFQRGGSVNPFEETARAGRDIGRRRDISGPRTRAPLRPREYEAPNMQNEIFRDVEDKEILNPQVGGRLENIFRRGKSTYDWLNENPYVPDEINIGKRTLGYEFEPEFLGGDLDINFGYNFNEDNPYASFEYTKTFNRGGLMSLI